MASAVIVFVYISIHGKGYFGYALKTDGPYGYLDNSDKTIYCSNAEAKYEIRGLVQTALIPVHL